MLRERQNARYDAVVASAPDAIVTFDAEGMIQLANPAAAAEFGRAAEEMIGQPVDRLLDDPAWMAAWRSVLAGTPCIGLWSWPSGARMKIDRLR